MKSPLGFVKSDAGIVASGQLTEQVCILLRNLLVVRSMTQAEYGAAATLLVSLTIIQSSTDFGIQKLLVHDREGNEERFQSTVQLANFAQGLIVALIMFLSGPILASLFNLPEMVWAYQLLALVPFILGLVHYDMYRAERNSRFGPSTKANIAGQLFSLLVVLILMTQINDYRIVLASMIAIPIGTFAASHLLATRPYRLTWDKAILRRAVTFGWPLLANGVFFAIVNQSDRFLLGSAERILEFARSLSPIFEDVVAFSKSDLAVYSIALSLTFLASRLISGPLSKIMFPLLASLQDDRDVMRQLYRAGLRVHALIAAIISVGFVLFGSSLVGLLYGESYRGTHYLIGVLALVQGARVLRVPIVTTSFALGDSQLPMYANMFRALSVVGSAAVVLLGLPLVVLGIVALATELLTLLIALWLLKRSHAFELTLSLGGLAFFFTSGGFALLLSPQVAILSDLAGFALTAVGLILVMLAAAVALPGVYRHSMMFITRRGSDLSFEF